MIIQKYEINQRFKGKKETNKNELVFIIIRDIVVLNSTFCTGQQLITNESACNFNQCVCINIAVSYVTVNVSHFS